MLRRLWNNPLGAIAIGSTIGLFLLALFSWEFGLGHDICDEPNAEGNQNCSRQNLVLFLLWKALKTIEAGSELITAIATVLLFVVTYLLVKLGRSQDRTSRAQMRPYVFVHGLAFEREGTILKIKMGLKNFSSATPALAVRISMRVGGGTREFLPTYPPAAEAEGKARSIIGPNTLASYIPELDLPELTDEHWQNFLDAKFILHFWGRIDYEDVFGESYFTEFRLINRGGPDYKERGFPAIGAPTAT